MSKNESNRGNPPSDATTRMLCGAAAGMCEFEGCGKRLFYDNLTLTKFNNANVAHIIASSPDGPRGDPKLSHELSDKLSNLMLMCADHHLLIDKKGSGPRDYPVEKLRTMKKNHEEQVAKFCNWFKAPKTQIVPFSSPIKGKKVSINLLTAEKAVIPEKQPYDDIGREISIESIYEYGSKEYWNDVLNQLKVNTNSQIFNLINRNHDTEFSIFPLAPIPLIIQFGELLGDKVKADIFQKTREPDTWKWMSKDKTNAFNKQHQQYDDGKQVALVISLTAEISFDRVKDVINPSDIYVITAEHHGVDCIKSKIDLLCFWHTYHEVCDEILNIHGKNTIINLFPAVPVSVAFEIGRRYMSGTYPKMLIYDEYKNGFKKTITIGGQNV